MHEFWDLQDTILKKYGQVEPGNPVLRVRNITQTSLTLEWDPLELHTAELRALEIYKNDTKLAHVRKAKATKIEKKVGCQSSITVLARAYRYTYHEAIRIGCGS